MKKLSDIDQGRLEGLRHALTLVRGRRVLNRTIDYLAAIHEMEIFIEAAIERVEHGETMNVSNVVTS